MKNLICKIFLFFIFLNFFYSEIFAYVKTFFTKEDVVFGDGDTINVNGKTLRFLGVDTPEVQGENFIKNQYLGKEASLFTKKQILSAKSLYYVEFKKDRYDRSLAFVFVDDELLPIKIIKAGLGYETVSFYKNNYDEADKSEFENWDNKIKSVADDVGDLNFQNPFYWRHKNKIKKPKGLI